MPAVRAAGYAMAQPSVAHAVFADESLAPLVLRPLLVADAAWSSLDAAKAVARVGSVCRALRRAAAPLWHPLVLQRWPSAALAMRPQEDVPPLPAAHWCRLYRQRHLAAAGMFLREPSCSSNVLRGYDFSVDVALDGQPFASVLLPERRDQSGSRRHYWRSDATSPERTRAAAPAAGARIGAAAAQRLRATLFAHRSCPAAVEQHRRCAPNTGTAFACLLDGAFAVQPAPAATEGVRVLFEFPLRHTLLVRLELKLDPAPPEDGAAAPGAAEGSGGGSLLLSSVHLSFVHVTGNRWDDVEEADADALKAALVALHWQEEVLAGSLQQRRRHWEHY